MSDLLSSFGLHTIPETEAIRDLHAQLAAEQALTEQTAHELRQVIAGREEIEKELDAARHVEEGLRCGIAAIAAELGCEETVSVILAAIGRTRR